MSTTFFQLLLFGLLAGLANVLGGLILYPSSLHDSYKKYLRYLLALGAGFMLGVTFIEIVPKSVGLWQKPGLAETSDLFIPMLLILFGYLLTQFFEHTVLFTFLEGEILV